jgi:CHAD domain-containing protein
MKKAKRGGGLDIGSALATLAARESHALLQALGAHQGYHGGIHETRRACRRLRSLLAFVALTPGATQVEALDKSLKKLTRGFSQLRDAHVVIRTAHLLASTQGTGLTPALIELLERQCASQLDAALERDPAWRKRSAKAQGIVSALQALNWQTISPGAARACLKHSVARMKKARRIALEQRTDEAFHRWRRRAREVRYQLESLRKARQLAGMKKKHQYSNRIKRLGLIIDRLGWRQDFQTFRRALEHLPAHADVLALRQALAEKSVRLSKISPAEPRDAPRTSHANSAPRP